MAEKLVTDVFTERAIAFCNIDHLNADVYSKLWDLGLSSRDLVAIVISRVEVYYGSFANWTDQLCYLGCAISGKSLLNASLAADFLTNPGTYWHDQINRAMLTSGSLENSTRSFDYSGLPGGGILAPAKPLYISSWSDGLLADFNVQVEMRYRLVPMDQSNYLDLIQSMMGIGLQP